MGSIKKDVPMADITNSSRWPKESPPIEKKRLKRLGATWHGEMSQSSLSESSSDENLASLSDGLSRRPKSILRQRMKRCTSSSSGRRVQFNTEMFVQRLGEDGETSEGIESLCLEEKDRKAFMSRNLQRMAQSHQTDACLGIGSNSHSPPHYPQQGQGLVFSYHEGVGAGTPQLSPEVHISFHTDEAQKGTTRLKMLVNVGARFQPDEICVKANVSGNKIRVMATKVIEGADGARHSEPFNERFLLPMEVDPYAVEARLDSKGNLTIEAPLMTHARKSDIAKGNKNSSQATKSL